MIRRRSHLNKVGRRVDAAWPAASYLREGGGGGGPGASLFKLNVTEAECLEPPRARGLSTFHFYLLDVLSRANLDPLPRPLDPPEFSAARTSREGLVPLTMAIGIRRNWLSDRSGGALARQPLKLKVNFNIDSVELAIINVALIIFFFLHFLSSNANENNTNQMFR